MTDREIHGFDAIQSLKTTHGYWWWEQPAGVSYEASRDEALRTKQMHGPFATMEELKADIDQANKRAARDGSLLEI